MSTTGAPDSRSETLTLRKWPTLTAALPFAMVAWKKAAIKRIAWATRAQDNGYITRWTCWHISKWLTCQVGETLCGREIPHTKWITQEPDDTRGDFRVRGGECTECKRLSAIADSKRSRRPRRVSGALTDGERTP